MLKYSTFTFQIQVSLTDCMLLTFSQRHQHRDKNAENVTNSSSTMLIFQYNILSILLHRGTKTVLRYQFRAWYKTALFIQAYILL